LVPAIIARPGPVLSPGCQTAQTYRDRLFKNAHLQAIARSGSRAAVAGRRMAQPVYPSSGNIRASRHLRFVHRNRCAQAQVNSYLFGDRSQLSGARDRMFYLSAICPPSFGSVRATLPNTAPSQHTPKVRSAFAWWRRERWPTTPAPLCYSRQGRARAMSYRDLGD
jgi:hypothetical protein